MEVPKFLTSSVDPEKLALSVKGFLVLLIPVIIAVSGMTQWNLGQEDLTLLVNAVGEIVFYTSSIIAGLMVVYGLIRKVLVAMGVIKVNG